MSQNLSRDRRLARPLRTLLLLAAVVTALVGAVSAVMNIWPAPAPCSRSNRPPDLGALEALAQSVPKPSDPVESKLELSPGGKPPSLAEVTIASSKELQNLYSRLTSNADASKTTSIVFVYAPAGSGKTPVLEHLRDRAGIAYVDLKPLNAAVRQGDSTWATREPELRLHGREVSWQPKIRVEALKGGLEEFVSRLTGSKPDFSKGLLLDSIDEVHPDSALELLKAVALWSSAHPNQVVVVAGRGEGFRDYVVHNDLRSTQKMIRLPSVYVGSDPLLAWHVYNYAIYTGSDQADPKGIAKSLTGLRELMTKHPFTRHFLYAGALGKFATENVAYSNQTSQRLEDLMFQDLIVRNKGTHNRPQQDDLGVWTLYKDALIQIARKYTPEPETGVFVVGELDTVCVKDGDKYVDVNVGSVLMRSGLVDLNPVTERHLEFSFWPKTLHRFLAVGLAE